MLQFRSDDTVRWLEGFGTRADGDATPSGTFANPNTTFSGVETQFTGTVGSNSGFSIGDIVFIHQTRNGGDGAGVWQLNKITGISGTTFTFKYALQQDFGTTAQIIKVNQNKNIVINGTLTDSAWDGSIGGIAVLMGDSISGSGTINLNSKGFRGGNGSSGEAQQGEGTDGAGGTSFNLNGNGAGGGERGPDGSHVEGGHGAGGGNATAGNNGSGKNTAQAGIGGSSVGNSGLTIIDLGGGAGGGGGKRDGSNTGTNGANGSGILILIARSIDTSGMTIISSNGGDSAGNNDAAGCGGGGAGGSILLKGQTLILGTNKITALAGTGGTSTGGFNGQGANGSVGRIHADYLTSISGTTNPTIDTRQDNTLVDPGGGFLGLI